MSREAEGPDAARLALTAQVLAAYVSNHNVPPAELPALAKTIHQSLSDAAGAAQQFPGREPAVPIDQSITDSHLVCLEDGKPYQSLKRHLRVAYGLSPQAYREKWGLPPDYPMVSPAYARRRSELARQSGLGKSADDKSTG
ncbi:MAG: MucR family transcriptional regulator [Pseudomonadota bacterium]